MEECEDFEPSQLQGAFKNYLRSRDSSYPSTQDLIEKYDREMASAKKIFFFVLVFLIYLLIVFFNQEHPYKNVIRFSLVWPWFLIFVFGKAIHWKYFLKFCKIIFCCPWGCFSNNPSEDIEAQLSEDNDYDEADTIQEQPVNQSRDLHEEIDDQSTSFLFCSNLSFSNMYTFFQELFCYPWSRCISVDTGFQEIQAEETDNQSTFLHNLPAEQVTYQPDALHATSEENINEKLKTREEQILRYLLDGTDELDCPSV